MYKQIKCILFTIGLFFVFSIASAQSVDDLLRQDHDPMAGNRNGKITVVEFFDYQCSHCITMAPTISAIIKANPDVRIVFKEFPIRGPISELATRAALAANMQGKYYVFSHALLTASQPLTEDSIYATAKSTGLNVVQLKKDMNSKSVQKQLEANWKLAEDFKLSGTPVFFIGKTDAKDSSHVKFVLGEMSQAELQDAINEVKA